MTAVLPELHLTEVDGVPTLWADIPGPLRAALVLRVGTADETLVTAGISHLVEHLALFGIDRPGDHSNGHVDSTTTVYHCVGDGATAVEFMAAVTRQLSRLPVDRLEVERDILRAEAAGQKGSLHDNLAIWRYGAGTYGLSAQEQLGIEQVGADQVQAWADRYATRDNAVLWVSGPLPAGLRLELPAGARRPAPPAGASVLTTYPAWFSGPANTVALSATLPRGYANQALAFVLQRRLVDELRTRRGVAYSPSAAYRALDGEVGELYAASDLVSGRASDGVRPFCAALDELAGDANGVQPEEVTQWRAMLERERTEPMAPYGMLVGNAFELVHGKPLIRPEEQQARTEAVTAAEVAGAARTAMSSALASIPDGVRLSREPWTPAPVSGFARLTGTTHYRVGRPADAAVLVLGPEGVMLAQGESQHIAVPVTSVAAVQHWADGRRVLVASDATRVVLEPTLWEDGSALVAQVDALMPASVRVDMGTRRPDEIPKPPAATAASGPTPAPGTAARPVWDRAGPKIVFALFVLLALAFVIGAVAFELPAAAIGAAAFGYSAYDLRRKAKKELR